MSRTRHGFGSLGNNDNDNKYLRRFVCIEQIGGHSVYGILQNIDGLRGHAYFRPSIVGNADGSLVIVRGLPTKMDFPLTIIRPMPGTLENYVEVYNKELKKKKKKGQKKTK